MLTNDQLSEELDNDDDENNVEYGDLGSEVVVINSSSPDNHEITVIVTSNPDCGTRKTRTRTIAPPATYQSEDKLNEREDDVTVVPRVYNNRRGGECLTAIGTPNTLL